MSMASQEDGGKAALAGFLYQILGFVGLKASVQCSRDYNKGDGLDVLIRVVRDGRTEHEASGQDVVIRSILEAGEGLTLVQFKYSWRFPPRPVYKAEYTTIVEKLAKSGLQAETDGKLVKGYFLVTNRRVPPKSKTGVVHRHKGKAGAKSKAPSVRKGRFEERLRSAKSMHEADIVRRSLHVLDDLPSDHWSAKLNEFAARYGCEDREVREGIERLVGQVVIGTVHSGERTIEEADLIEAFTRCRTASALTYNNLQVRSLKTAEDFSTLLYTRHPVRQRILDELSKEVSQRAFVILEGPGGTGKSTALADWVQAAARSSPPKIGALTWVLRERDATWSH